MSNKPNALKLLKQADRYKVHEVNVDIPLDGDEAIKAKLISPDLFKVQEELEDLKKAALMELRADGYHLQPIDEEEWEAEVDGFKKSSEYKELTTAEKKMRLKQLAESKPRNLAEQRAPYKARLRIVKSILPSLLRDRETGEMLFPTREEVNAVSEIIGSNPELMTLLSSAYAKLSAKSEQTKKEIDEAKN